MARTRSSAWFWITLTSIGAVIMATFLGLRISGFLGGPGIDLYDIPSRSMVPTLMVGDNRDHTNDSRFDVGYVPLALLRDKPVIV